MARGNMSRTARPGTTSGGWTCQTRKIKEHAEKRAKKEGMSEVKAQVEKKDQATQVTKQAADKCTQTYTQTNDFAADMAPGYQRWSTKA